MSGGFSIHLYIYFSIIKLLEYFPGLSEDKEQFASVASSHPVLLWWYPFTGHNTLRKCGDVACFSTNNRKYRDHDNLKV